MNLKSEKKLIKDFENNFIYYFKNLQNNKKNDELINFYRQILAIESGKLYPKTGLQIYKNFYEKFNEKPTINLITYINNLIKQKNIHKYISKDIYKNKSFKSYLYPLLKANFWNFYALMHVIVIHNSDFNSDDEVIVTDSQYKNIDYAFKFLSKLIVFRALKSYGRVESNRDYAQLSYKLNEELNKNKSKQPFKEIFHNIVIKFLEESGSRNRIPKIEEITKEIESPNKDIYNDNKTTLKYILIAIDEYMSDYCDIISKEKIDDTQIEHIIPQKFDKNEKYNYLNNDQKNEIKNWIHTLGNLTILESKANKKANNKSIKDKEQIYIWNSSYRLNLDFVEKHKEHNLYVEDILKNSKRILDYIIKLWEN